MIQWPGPLGLGPDGKRSSQHATDSLAFSNTDGYVAMRFPQPKSSDKTLVAPTCVSHKKATKITKTISTTLFREKYIFGMEAENPNLTMFDERAFSCWRCVMTKDCRGLEYL
ncbi:hypothetical protein CsSME_00034549 [Camellia sinensis var. sinensis]